MRLKLDYTVRLLVNMTQPTFLCFNSFIPEEKTLRHNYLDLETQLQTMKEVGGRPHVSMNLSYLHAPIDLSLLNDGRRGKMLPNLPANHSMKYTDT